MKKKIFILSISLFSIFSCNASSKNNKIELGDASFCVSKKYNILDQTKGSILNIKGTGDSNYGGSFQVSIDPDEVKKSIPDYFLKHGDLPASFIVNVRLSSMNGLDKLIDRNYYADTLQLVNDYENSQID